MRENAYGDEILEIFDTFSTEKATVWIDPLDGTKDFCNGNLSAVTVLVGLAIDGVPKIGVVHNPFKTNENDGVGMTMFATQEHGAYQLDYDSKMS
jgi:3'-phosphoadenosine 5'-phosphosulfate (PAPS) 3'-phosphatase|tara:strand:+ start:356 stop:640 length:285 start_codon:yes stop_codon:yes gene_type:complete